MTTPTMLTRTRLLSLMRGGCAPRPTIGTTDTRDRTRRVTLSAAPALGGVARYDLVDSGASQAVPPSRPPSSGHSPLNTPQLHSKPGTTHACIIQTSTSSTLRPPRSAHSCGVDVLATDDHATLAGTDRRWRCAGASGRSSPAKPGRRTAVVVHEVAEPDDLRVGRRCRRTTAPTASTDRSCRRARCSCSARRCTARRASTCRSRRPAHSQSSGTARRRHAPAVICFSSSTRCACVSGSCSTIPRRAVPGGLGVGVRFRATAARADLARRRRLRRGLFTR